MEKEIQELIKKWEAELAQSQSLTSFMTESESDTKQATESCLESCISDLKALLNKG